MRITNFSNINMEFRVNDIQVCIKPNSSFEYGEQFDYFTLSPGTKSYSTLEANKSSLLKFLSVLDDPFKLIKEYHIVVNSFFVNENVCNSQQLNVTAESYWVDADTRIYYDYVKVEADGNQIKPIKLNVLTSEEISNDFFINNKRLCKWQSIWDILIEPIIPEIIGCFVLYHIFSIWFAKGAWNIVFFLIGTSVLFELLMLVFKKKKYKKRIVKFQECLSIERIYNCCYESSC